MKNVWLFGTLAIVTVARTAIAEAPSGLMEEQQATSGETNVATEGFEAPAATPDPKSKDATEADVSAGGLWAIGNSRAVSLTGAAKMRLRRGDNQFSLAASGNYAQAATEAGPPMETTVENMQGKVRYDRFLAGGLAAFLAVSARRDRFQGLDLRLNVDPGLAFYFIDEDNHQLWVELGYDLQYDVRRDETIAAAAVDGEVVEKTETRHSGRLFAGYDNKVNDAVTFSTGVEYLQSVEEAESWRLNWTAGLTSSVGGNFSVATTLTVLYDNNPLPGVETTDATTAVSLVYTLF